MLAVNVDDVEIVSYPMLGQPKLNGIRACWNGLDLVTRRNEVWRWAALPHIYDKLKEFSIKYPGIYLDGEIYCHGMPLQEIVRRGAVIRRHAHEDVAKLDFHVFDIISKDDTMTRITTLMNIYRPWVPVCKVCNDKERDAWLARFVQTGFEGLILRQFRCPYLPNRTEALIKIKPWQTGIAEIVSCIEGKDSFAGMLGAFKVKWQGKEFKIGGGNITIEQRKAIWAEHTSYQERRFIPFRYRDTSSKGVPLQPQIMGINTK